MTINEQQWLFMSCLGKLITEVEKRGYRLSGGDLKAIQRLPLEHKKNSQHYKSLAIDLNLFDSEGKYLTRTEAHKIFGEYWETLHPFCRWGGRYLDGNHYEVIEGWRGK